MSVCLSVCLAVMQQVDRKEVMLQVDRKEAMQQADR